MAVVRAMAITYGAQAIPGTVAGANVTLHNVHKLTKGPDRFECEFDLLVDGGSEVTLAAAASALETTFTTRRAALTVALNGNNVLTIDDANRSGLDVTPSIEKVGDADPPDRFDTNTSRLYRIRIEAGLPSLGTGNRAQFSYDVSFSASRRTELTVSGIYTATEGGSASSANYLSLISARVAVITAALGGTFELTSETYTPDDVDGFTSFQRTYKSILFNQSSGSLNNPAIVDPNLSITRRQLSDEGEGTADPLIELSAQYSTSVDVTVNSSLTSVWENIVLPLIANQLEVVAGGGVAIIDMAPSFDFYRHTINASITAQAVGNSSLLSKNVETLDEVDYGKIIRDVWPVTEFPDDERSSSPTPSSAFVYQAARVITRTITTTTEEVSTEAFGGAVPDRNSRTVGSIAEVEQVPLAFVVGGVEIEYDVSFTAIRMTRSTRSKRKKRGLRDVGSQIDVLERTVTEGFRIIVPQEGS